MDTENNRDMSKALFIISMIILLTIITIIGAVIAFIGYLVVSR